MCRPDYHLQLRPGTNVAVINAIAHVIATEGLVDRALCRSSAAIRRISAAGSTSSASRSNSPEATEAVTGVPAAELRAAARLYATGGNGAIYYGLGVTEHSQGSTTVMAMANLAMATGNLGREWRGHQSAAWPEQCAGCLRHGLIPP